MSTRLHRVAKGAVLVLTLESDDGCPRLERALLDSLAREIHALRADSNLKGAVITGSEQAFAAGAEIAELAKLTPAEAFEFARAGQRVLRVIEGSRKPIVAAIRGYCMGGGLDLALACHVRIAAPDSVFAHPGGALGIITGWGGTQRLPRLIGRSRAMELLIKGRRIEAEKALNWGLISRVAPIGELIHDAFRQILEHQSPKQA